MIRGKEEKSQIVAICHKFKGTFDNLIDCLNPKSSDRLGLIDQRSRNMPRSRNSSIGLSKGDCLNKNILDYWSIRQASENRDS